MRDVSKPRPTAMKLEPELESAPRPAPEPYRSTPESDEVTLPAALGLERRTKPCVWGVVRLLEGQAKLTFADRQTCQILSSGSSGLLLPDQPHFAEPIGSMRQRVDFYDRPRTQ